MSRPPKNIILVLACWPIFVQTKEHHRTNG